MQHTQTFYSEELSDRNDILLPQERIESRDRETSSPIPLDNEDASEPSDRYNAFSSWRDTFFIGVIASKILSHCEAPSR